MAPSQLARAGYGGSQYSLLMCLQVLESVWMAPMRVHTRKHRWPPELADTRGDLVLPAGSINKTRSLEESPMACDRLKMDPSAWMENDPDRPGDFLDTCS